MTGRAVLRFRNRVNYDSVGIGAVALHARRVLSGKASGIQSGSEQFTSGSPGRSAHRPYLDVHPGRDQSAVARLGSVRPGGSSHQVIPHIITLKSRYSS